MSARSPYDARLPILAELEEKLESAARAHQQATQSKRQSPVAVERGSWTARLRAPRRVAILAAVIFLVGATATATVSIWRSNSVPVSEQVVIEEGDAPVPHQFEVHTLGQRLCATFLLSDAVNSTCLHPVREAEAMVYLLKGSFNDFVYGIAGPAASSVAINTPTGSPRVPAHPLPAKARDALPRARGLRYFVTSVPRSERESGSVAIRVFSAAGSRADGTRATCSLLELESVGCHSN